VILLASRSPQRRALLAALGVPFRVVVPRTEEGEDPLANARAKAREVAARGGVPEGGAVLGVDTEVILDGRALGKPADEAAARRELRALSGRTHVVRSAICVITQTGEREAMDDARVTFRPLSDAAIDRYVATGEWRDRAGGYAIQGAGADLVERVEGDHSTVVGLPVGRLAGLLDELGLAERDRGG
jgi:nucleoside triphosphate pyrophosphatase